MTVDDRPARRDVQRNRAKLLAAAYDLFAARGTGVGHDEIAAAAGVGVGTAYRHFPRKEDLLEAVFHDHLDQVVLLAEHARDQDDPVAGLHGFLNAMLERQAAHRGLADVLRGRRHPALVREASARVTPVVGELVARAQQAGGVGPDVVPGDLVLVEFMVAAVMDASGPRDADLWRRGLGLLLAGLGVPRPLPRPVPDAAVIDRLYSGQ